MATIQQIRDEVTNLLLRVEKLNRVPLELQALLDQGKSSLERLRARAAKESPRDLDLDIVRAIVDLELGRGRIVRETGLEDDPNLEDCREAAKEVVLRAKAWLDRTRGRDLTAEARRNVAEVERKTRKLEDGVRLFDHREAYLERVKELTEEISTQVLAFKALPDGERAWQGFLRYLMGRGKKSRSGKQVTRRG